MDHSRNTARRIAILGIFTALAFILGFIESLIPPFTGIPGVKAGFANIVTMIALYLFGAPATRENGVTGSSVTVSGNATPDPSHKERTASVKEHSPYIVPSFYSLLAALGISTVRIALGGITYNGMSAMLYGLAGAYFSLIVMFLLARTRFFSVTAVSVAGGVAHNIAQLLLAVLMLGNAVYYYLPMLIISGCAAGLIIGLIAALLIRRLYRIL